MTFFKYKGYLGTVESEINEPEVGTNTLFGKLVNINDLVTYEAKTFKELEKEFRTSVDIYLESCEELGKKRFE